MPRKTQEHHSMLQDRDGSVLEEHTKKALGQRIKRLRTVLRMSQVEMLRAMGRPERSATAVDWEKGGKKRPVSQGVLRDLAALTTDPLRVYGWLRQGGVEPGISQCPEGTQLQDETDDKAIGLVGQAAYSGSRAWTRQEPPGAPISPRQASEGGVLPPGEARGTHRRPGDAQERQARLAGVAARAVGGAVKGSLEQLPPSPETREAIADGLRALALRLSQAHADVSGLLAVEELTRRGDL